MLINTKVRSYIVVNREGMLYKVDMFDKNCRLIPAVDLQRLLCSIIHYADKHQGTVVYCGKQGGYTILSRHV